MRRMLVTLTAIAGLGLGCDNTTGVISTGTWEGDLTLVQQLAPWHLVITLKQSGDSITGDATVSGGFNEAYFVNGKVFGDSVTIRLRPVEDADINIAGRMSAQQIVGLAWFNQPMRATMNIVLDRQGPTLP